MTEYMTEQEQIQQIKNWLKQYGLTIIAGIVIALAITTGWRYWQNYQNTLLTQASAVYDQLLLSRTQKNTATTKELAEKILAQYPKTPYAVMAALLLAQNEISNNHYSEAVNQLNWVLKHAHEKSLRQIARLRLARLMISQKQPDEALSLLKKIDDKHFGALIEEVRGDAYLAKDDKASARDAYKLALQQLPEAEMMRPILQMKVDNLAN